MTVLEAERPAIPKDSEIDWEANQDVQLVEQYGLTRERWRQRRRAGNYPNARNMGKDTKRVTLASKLKDLDTTQMTFSELHKKFNGSKDHLRACLKELGKEYQRG